MTAPKKPRILLLGEIIHAHQAWSEVSKIAEIIEPKSTRRDEFLQEALSDAFDHVSVIYRTNRSFPVTGKVDKELLEVMPTSLKFICQNSAGLDQIDIAACTAHNIRISHTPNAVDDATADMTIWLLLGALRNLPVFMQSARDGLWRGNPMPRLGHDPRGKVLGILGMGGIGRNVAQKARAFGMLVRYHNRSRLEPELEGGAEYVNFETLLKESDVLSLNLPLNSKTYHIISAPELSLMKTGSTIINTARGAILDEEALLEALESGQIANAGLDVFENEPKIHPRLVSHPKVLLVPHMGTLTVETGAKMEAMTVGNVMKAIREAKLVTPIPEQSFVSFL